MANPQPEPFVKFSKELFDALLLSAMPATHKEIVLAVIRRTYGDHGKKVAPISHSLIRRMTGRSDSGIRKSMAALEEEGVLVQVEPPTFRTPAFWQLNKNYEKWGRWSVRSATVVAEGHELAEGHEGGSGECHHSGSGDRQTLAEGSATTVAPLKTLDLRDLETTPPCPPTGGDDDRVRDQEVAELAAFYVHCHNRRNLTPPDGRRTSKYRAAAKDCLQLGGNVDNLQKATDRLVEQNKAPAYLATILGDVEREAQKANGNGHNPDARRIRVKNARDCLAAGGHEDLARNLVLNDDEWAEARSEDEGIQW